MRSALLGLFGLCAALWSPTTIAAESRPPSVVPVDVLALAPPTPVKGEGAWHMLYELRLTNFSGRPMALEAIEVRDGDGGAILATTQGDVLAGQIVRPGQVGLEDVRILAPGAFAVVFLEALAPAATIPPKRLAHRLRFRSDKPGASESRTVIDGPIVEVSARPPILLGPPLKGAGWLAANAMSNNADHRRTIAVVDGRARIAQRFAIDFVRLDEEGRAFRDDAGRNESWVGYGAEVLAVADGRVVAVKDGLPDNAPGAAPRVPISLDTIGGNSVVLEIGSGRYVFYGHLQPGGVLVKPGQAVRRGQVIGRLGDSGQSDAPHLHIHVSDGVSALGGEGLPYAFEAFQLAGHVPSLEVLEDPKGWRERATAKPQAHRGELPVENAVVDFRP